MRKTLLFAVVLLLIFSLPTVSMAGWREKTTPHTVTFVDDIVGGATLDIYEHNKIIIEWERIALTFDASMAPFAGLHSDGWLYMKIHKGERASVRYYFDTIDGGKYDGFPKYLLAGSGIWSEPPKTITCTAEPFTIYELVWQGRRNVKAYVQGWTGLLSFTIVMVPV